MGQGKSWGEKVKDAGFPMPKRLTTNEESLVKRIWDRENEE